MKLFKSIIIGVLITLAIAGFFYLIPYIFTNMIIGSIFMFLFFVFMFAKIYYDNTK